MKITSKLLENLEIWKKWESVILENYSAMEQWTVDNKTKWSEIYSALNEKPKLETEEIKMLRWEASDLEAHYAAAESRYK